MACISFRATRYPTVNPFWVLSGRTELSHPPLPFSTYVPSQPPLPHYVLLLSGFTAKSMLYLVPRPVCAVLFPFVIPSSQRGLLEQISFVLSCYLNLRYPPLSLLPRMVSLQLLSCFFTSSLDSNVLFPQIDLLSKFALSPP